MKIIAGMATMPGREYSLKKAVKSLSNQVDEIIVYDNGINPDIADNGKFFGLTQLHEPCYYFTCDDDILYPKNYVSSMIEAIEATNSIVSHHGRILKGKDKSYYRGHDPIRCLDENMRLVTLDVCGTGVTAFRTDYFNPITLIESVDLRMSDIIFSLEAKRQGKKIISLPHNKGWIKQLPIDMKRSICTTESKKEGRQIELANEIWNLKNLK